ncbi:hypothetical protein JJC03_13310 [Flavobacterium oreochromis]|uniref:toxin-antitoxin system YwqK family antitoxin n=1 Tax=Flavobacterium oreochromis TaxID=2906078 RepID=UPI001CE6E456|nr:hypothetical protein [Flavobacterium oreochromis]QYS86000.1 hypothetical protein JJC03_13310 [Flavobacterium oreochromis]
MKNLILFILLLIFISCKKNKVIERINPENNEREIYNYIIKEGDTVLQGKSYTYNQDGALVLKCSYKNNKLDGNLYRFFDSGKLKEIQNLRNGMNDGIAVSYFKNGKINTLLTYSRDTLCGDGFYNYENGNLRKYMLYDSLGKVPFIIRLDSLGRIKSYEGKPVNCFLDSDKIKFGEKFKMDCMLANIPNTIRKVEFIYSDFHKGKIKIKKSGVNYLLLEETKYKKGKNLLYVIVTYKFNKKYYNQILKDTAFIDYYVN